MLSEKTRNAIANDIMLALKYPETETNKDIDVLVIKATRKIFHTEWNDKEILVTCKFIRKNGTADLYWPGGTEEIYKQTCRFAYDLASDSQLVEWLKVTRDVDGALKFIVRHEHEAKND